MLYNPTMTTDKARSLRKNLTDSERLLWSHLRLRHLGGCRFRRQCPIGPYIVDFACFEKRLVIEIDGGHHGQQTEYDLERTAWLESQNFVVIRFWNNDVLREIDTVKQDILNKLQSIDPPL